MYGVAPYASDAHRILAEAHFNKRARHHRKRYVPRRMTLFLVAAIVLAAIFGSPYLGLAASDMQAEPEASAADFTTTVIASPGGIPTALAATPDGRLLIGNQGGRLRVYDINQSKLLDASVLDVGGISCTDNEQGLEGVAVDPNFGSNKYIYIYHTYCSGNDRYNRVVRYVLNTDNTTSGATPILTHIPAICGNHNGGDLKFDADGLLYVSVGDGGCGTGNDRARDWSTMSGKILRINTDGSIPASNPWVNPSGSVNSTRRCSGSAESRQSGVACQEVIARGLRNPFRMAFKHGTNEWHINDVGQGTWEEINLGQVGGDYGWNQREGNCVIDSASNCGSAPTGMTNPILALSHNDGFCAITGGAFAAPGQWPAPYDGGYFFGDYCKSNVYFLNRSGTPSAQSFTTGSYGVIAVTFDPNSSALYFGTRDGDIRRVKYTGTANRPPIATGTAVTNYGPVPLTVQFEGSASDPDNDNFTATWNFGDGQSATGLSVSHTYETAGTYTAVLTVVDSKGAASTPVQIKIFPGNTPPDPVISAPILDKLFRVGEQITLSGTATDSEDGDVSASMSWKVLLHHVPYRLQINEHVHPFLTKSGNNIVITAPPPEDLDAAPLSFLEIQLTATDKAGLSRTVTQTLRPNRVAVTFNTSPAGLVVDANTTRVTASTTITSWEGATLSISTPQLQQAPSGQMQQFQSWSDGGAIAHPLNVDAPQVAVTATFVPSDSMPVAIALADPINGPAPLQVRFDGSRSSDNNNSNATLRYLWNFGDGTTSTEVNPTHVYLNAGSYNAQLSVTDSAGLLAKSTPISIQVKTINRTPNALIASAVAVSNTPVTMRFSSAGSSDPDGDLLYYYWQFGDGGKSSEANPTHTYAQSGSYSVTLTVGDGGVQSAPATLGIKIDANNPNVNQPPQPSIMTPLAEMRFSVGQVVTLTGSAVDPEGENVNKSLRWTVMVKSPRANPTSTLDLNNVSVDNGEQTTVVLTKTGEIVAIGPLSGPVSLAAAPYSYYEVQLTAVDAKGSSSTVTQTLLPNYVPMTFRTTPEGMRVMVNDIAITGTRVITSWQNYKLNVSAPDIVMAVGGAFYKFSDWSNGGQRAQSLVTPATATTYTASFVEVAVTQTFMPMARRP